MEAVEGVPTTFGSQVFADAPAAAADGLIPRRLKAAGAIVVGKTNQPEFAFAGFTDNLLYGATRNPWNLEAIAGRLLAVGRPQRWRPGSPRSRPPPTGAARSGSRPAGRASSGTSRRTG